MKEKFKSILIWALFIMVLYLAFVGADLLDLISPVVEHTLIIIGINVILAAGLNLIIGFSGQFSLGHAGFMAIGAYTTAILSLKSPTLGGFISGILLGILISAIVALIVGIPTLRLKGDYLAIATLGVAEIIRIVIMNLNELTNGPAGLFGIPPMVNWSFVFGTVTIVLIILLNYIHSSAGRATISIRENEIAAESIGVNTTKYKVIAFTLGAITASVAGAIYASYIQTITPKDFGFMKSIDILIIVVLGGMGSMTGTVVAAFVLGLINMWLQEMGDLRMIIYALALIILMIYKPSGLLGNWEWSFSKYLNRKKLKEVNKNASIEH